MTLFFTTGRNVVIDTAIVSHNIFNQNPSILFQTTHTLSSSTKGNLNKLLLVNIYLALGKIASLEIRLHG